MSAAWRMYVLLPPMLGPVMISMRRASSKHRSFGMKGRGSAALDHRMTPALDAEHGLLHELGLRAIERRGALGEAHQHVELGHGSGGRLQDGKTRDQQIEHRLV